MRTEEVCVKALSRDWFWDLLVPLLVLFMRMTVFVITVLIDNAIISVLLRARIGSNKHNTQWTYHSNLTVHVSGETPALHRNSSDLP